MQKVFVIPDAKPMFAVMVDQEIIGLKDNGRDHLVLYETHEDAAYVAGVHPAGHVRQACYMDFVHYCLRRGYGLMLVVDDVLYTIERITRDPPPGLCRPAIRLNA